MPEYLIRMFYSEPRNSNPNSRIVEKEIKDVDDASIMERAFDMVYREKFLDRSVLGAEVYLKFSAVGFFVFVGRVSAGND